MTSEYGAGDNPPGPSGRRPATIDLTATEIPNPAQQETAATQSPPDTGAAIPPGGASPHLGSAASSDATPPGGAPSAPSAARSNGRGLALFAAGFAGAAAILMLAGTFWLGMLLAKRSEPAVPVVSAPSIDPALANRVAGAEENAKSAATAIAALRGRVDEIASAARAAQSRAEAAATTADAAQKAPSNIAEAAKNDIDTLTIRITALEKSLSALQAELQKRNAQADDHASRLAIAASGLQAAVLRGAPFPAELATVKSLGVDAKAVAPLEPFAASGLKSPEQLSRELLALIPAMRKPLEEQRPASGLLDKLQANAERLVRVRPVGDVSGDDANAILARVETRARQADIDGARSGIAKLPERSRAPAEAWLKAVEGRAEAVAAARQVAQDALAALGKAP